MRPLSDLANLTMDLYKNWKSHTLWTGPQILKQLPQIDLLCAAMGTTGTMSGLGTYLKGEKPSVFYLG
jgi:cysteine synthase